MRRACDVAGREDAGRRGLEPRVGDHAVVDVEPGVGGELGPRAAPRRRRRRSRSRSCRRRWCAPARRGLRPRTPRRRCRAASARRGRHGCRGRSPPSSSPSTRTSGSAAGSTTRHVQAALTRRGGELRADPARADDHDGAAAIEPRPQRVAVVDVAQQVHAVELRAGDRQPSRLGAGCEQEPVVAQRLAVVELEPAVRRVEAHRGAPQQQLDVVLRVEALAGGRGSARARARRAGSPWRAAAARRAAPSRRRPAPRAPRSRARAASRRPWRRRGSPRRSRTSAAASCVLHPQVGHQVLVVLVAGGAAAQVRPHAGDRGVGVGAELDVAVEQLEALLAASARASPGPSSGDERHGVPGVHGPSSFAVRARARRARAAPAGCAGRRAASCTARRACAASRSARTSIGTPLSVIATSTVRWRGVSTSRSPVAHRGEQLGGLGVDVRGAACGRRAAPSPSSSSGTSRPCHARRRTRHAGLQQRELVRPRREAAVAAVGRQLAQDRHQRVVGRLRREVVELCPRARAAAARDLEARRAQQLRVQRARPPPRAALRCRTAPRTHARDSASGPRGSGRGGTWLTAGTTGCSQISAERITPVGDRSGRNLT